MTLAWNSVQDLQNTFAGAWVSLLLGLVAISKTLLSGVEKIAAPFIEMAKKADFWKFVFKFLYIPINIVLMYRMLIRLEALGGA